MPTWNPGQYLKFDAERTQPCRDLVNRIALVKPRRMIDLGCGPGNSTAVLAERWPEADITGMDRSAEMIAAARGKFPKIAWEEGDLANWKGQTPYDLVFSNAALQWAPDHARVVPQLFEQVATGGALAWQVPANLDATAHRLMRVLAAAPEWRSHFTKEVREWFVHPAAFYYDLLASRAAAIEMWQTEYFHILDGPAAIVEWYKGTGLRPFLDMLGSAPDRERFLAVYEASIARVFPRQENGKVLFPFLRQFVIAYRS